MQTRYGIGIVALYPIADGLLRRHATCPHASPDQLRQSQKPVSATIEVLTQPKARNEKTPKSKRIGFVQWSPDHAGTYYRSAACTSQS